MHKTVQSAQRCKCGRRAECLVSATLTFHAVCLCRAANGSVERPREQCMEVCLAPLLYAAWFPTNFGPVTARQGCLPTGLSADCTRAVV